MSSAAPDLSRVKDICVTYGNEQRHLLAILQDTQRHYKYLPKDGLKIIAGALAIPLTKVFEVATFFKAFSLKPKGEHQCRVCTGTACHLRGAKLILEELERTVGVKNGDTTSDGLFSVESVNCVGACAMAPVMVINEQYHGGLTQIKVQKIIKNIKSKKA